MSDLSISIKNVIALLDDLKASTRRKILRKAIRRASGDIKKEVKAAVPKRSGALRVSIANKIWSGKRSAVVAGYISPKAKYRKIYRGIEQRPIRYAHIVERRKPSFRFVYARMKGYAGVIIQNIILQELEKIR
jgi:hypothetical protein